MASQSFFDPAQFINHGPGMSELPRTIRALREKLQLTQGQLGDALGVSRAAIQSWEAGTSAPRHKRLEKLAEALGTNVRGLVSGEASRYQAGQNIAISVQLDGAEIPLVAIRQVEAALWAKTKQKLLVLTEKSGRRFGIVATDETIQSLIDCLNALREFP